MANEKNSTAIGYQANASGANSTAIGHGTTVTTENSIAIGCYNATSVDSTNIFSVGNGIDSENRSNAHTLDWSGNAWFSGDVYVGSTSGTNKDEGSKKLATEDFVTAALTALGLPVPTAADAGKILRVNAQGKYELVAIANAEEATF